MTTTKPTLESLGLKCTIVSNGLEALNGEGLPMLKWNALFTNKRGQSEAFDYFTGHGCGPQPTEAELRRLDPIIANVPKHNRCNLLDKTAIPRIMLRYAQKRGWTPDPVEILWSIARDGDALESTLEDWASEFGYDADSRKAEKIYRACQDNALRLRKILSRDQIETLRNLDL